MNLYRNTVWRIIKYQETGSYDHRHRSRRPRTARTQANKRKIQGRIPAKFEQPKELYAKIGQGFGHWTHVSSSNPSGRHWSKAKKEGQVTRLVGKCDGKTGYQMQEVNLVQQ